MRKKQALVGLFALALLVACAMLACSAEGSGSSGPDGTDAGADADDASADAAILPDAAADATADRGPADSVPPGQVGDLAAAAVAHDKIELTWTAPADVADAGQAAYYELRVSAAPIVTPQDFQAAAVVPTPQPSPFGTAEKLVVDSLNPETAYHFAIASRDYFGNTSAPSNDATATTKARAQLLVTEVAVANTETEGYDFVELTVTKAGWGEGLTVAQFGTTLHAIAPLDLVVGERFVVHATGLPGPSGFDQEDVSKNKSGSTALTASANAYDVYSSTSGLQGSDNLISVMDGAQIIDAVALSNRDGDAASGSMSGWAQAFAAGAWAFGATPTDAVNDCASQKEAVGISSGSSADPACGGIETGFDKAMSINRNGTIDTNSKTDFYVATQSPGDTNAIVPAPSLVGASPSSATTVLVEFNQEIASTSVAPAAFTVPGLTVSAAQLVAVNRVMLTTNAQVFSSTSYTLSVSSAVTNLQGTALSQPANAAFCGYTALGALVSLNEINPHISSSHDLVELYVSRQGSLAGFELVQNPSSLTGGTVLATLPVICAAAGDYVIIHLNPDGSVGPASETSAKNQYPNSSYSANVDSAWDVRGGSSGLIDTNNVVGMRSPADGWTDIAAFSNGGSTSPAFRNALSYIQSQALWSPVNCGGATCDDASTPTAQAISASWSGVGTTPGGSSCQRTAGASEAASWTVASPTFGGAN